MPFGWCRRNWYCSQLSVKAMPLFRGITDPNALGAARRISRSVLAEYPIRRARSRFRPVRTDQNHSHVAVSVQGGSKPHGQLFHARRFWLFQAAQRYYRWGMWERFRQEVSCRRRTSFEPCSNVVLNALHGAPLFFSELPDRILENPGQAELC